MSSLTSRFHHAGLPLELRVVPLSADSSARELEIVQIDIAEGALKNRALRATSVTNLQRFRIYPGHAANALDVLDVDEAQHQLVLRVDEPERVFELHLRRGELPPEGEAIVRKERGAFVISRTTSGTVRHFLCGMDESHLFIAQLPELCDSVRDAHRALRPNALDALEAAAPALALRQGEWFFVPLSGDDEARVDALAKRTYRVAHKVGIAEAAGIRRIGRPHVAEEVVVLPEPASVEGVYVRGAVVHPDHRTIVLPAWHRTLPNTERIEAPLPGIDWFD